MDKDRGAKIAIEAQPHVEALLRIAKREKLDIVSIALYGTSEEHDLETTVLYIDQSTGTQYDSVRFLGENLKIRKNLDEYKTYIQT